MNTELVNNVRQWFHDKGIIQNSDTLKQIGKTQEELTETRDAAIRQQFLIEYGHEDFEEICQKINEELKDGIGDTLVTLIGIAEMERMIPYSIFNHKSQIPEAKSDDSLELLSEIQLWLLELYRVEKGFSMLQVLRVLVNRLDLLAKHYGFTLEECLQQAYDVISKRTGRMENGIFLKDKEVSQ